MNNPAAPPVRPKVLLVDDSSEVRGFLRSYLAPVYEVLEAGDGDEGLQIARAKMPDIIICDIRMPGLDGYAFCRAIKSVPETAWILTIILSGDNSPESRIRALESGADDYISKPFDSTELLLRIRNWMVVCARIRAVHTPLSGAGTNRFNSRR